MNFSNWSNSTIVAQAKGYALSQPDSNFVTFLVDGDLEEASLSYAQLDQRARQIAGWLQAQGCNKGDRAVVMLPNGLSFIEVFFSTMLLTFCIKASVAASSGVLNLSTSISITFLPMIFFIIISHPSY